MIVNVMCRWSLEAGQREGGEGGDGGLVGGEAEGAAAVVDLAEGVEAEGALGEHGRRGGRGRGRPCGRGRGREGGADEGGDGGPGLEEVGVVAHLAQLHQDVDHAHEVAALQRLLRLGPVGVGFASKKINISSFLFLVCRIG